MNGFAKLGGSAGAFALVCCLLASALAAQTTTRSPDDSPLMPTPAAAPATRPAAAKRHTLAYASLSGKRVEDVRVMGNLLVSTNTILNVVRTKIGDAFDPDTVEEDYQRIYQQKKFANVEAKAEPTATGVIVTFVVTEQRLIRQIAFNGNVHIDTPQLVEIINIHEGEAIDNFRIAIAKQSIESLYKTKNYPYAHVEFDRDKLAQRGELDFTITEGANVRVRKIEFIGNHSFDDSSLRNEIATKFWIWIFRSGTLDPEVVDDDVAALKRFYRNKGFFDARIGRKIVESPDQTQVKVVFVIDEGVRYIVEKITFRGNTSVSEAQLRQDLKLDVGRPFEADMVQRDVRAIVRAYSPFGFIYAPGNPDPAYLQIGKAGDPVKTVFQAEPGKVELIYDIHEGKPFKLGRIIIKGNEKTQEKVVYREMRLTPGQKYNSAEVQDAADRIRGTGLFSNAQMTPIGDDPDIRDLLVEVIEARTASFGVGAGINSNGGLGANISYEQRNFDISNWPDQWSDTFSDRAFIGAGQRFRVSLEPGTEATNASILFTEPWLFDQPYSLTGELYYRDRIREDWTETRAGGRATLGKRFDNIYLASLTARAENVHVHDLGDDAEQCPEIVEYEGYTFLTSLMLQLRRDTTNKGQIVYRGSNSMVAWESYGALGGDATFQKFTAGWDAYQTLHQDLLDRRTVLALHLDGGWIWGSQAPFFEKFYAGGIGTVRGFQFRGISPRCEDAPGNLPIGGDFSITGSAEVGFPLYGEMFRGVVFTDFGTVEPDVEIGTIRSSVGFGFRVLTASFGDIAVDFALPITKDDQDDTEWLSFSFGIQR